MNNETCELESADGKYLGPIGMGRYSLGIVPGRCYCGGELISRAEAGRDRLPTSGRHVVMVFGVITCTNGCRQYVNPSELPETVYPGSTPGFSDAELIADARRSRPAHTFAVSHYEKDTSTYRGERPLPEGEGVRLVCADCDAENPNLYSCQHATELR